MAVQMDQNSPICQQWYIFQAWIYLMAISTINLQFEPTGYLVKTFWLVGTSVSKYLLCTVQKGKKKKTMWNDWVSDNKGPVSVSKESFCSMFALTDRRWTTMKYASHWAQIKPDGVWMVLHQLIMTGPQKNNLKPASYWCQVRFVCQCKSSRWKHLVKMERLAQKILGLWCRYLVMLCT